MRRTEYYAGQTAKRLKVSAAADERVASSAEQGQWQERAVGDDSPGSAGPRPVPRRGTGRPRSLPPN